MAVVQKSNRYYESSERRTSITRVSATKRTSLAENRYFQQDVEEKDSKSSYSKSEDHETSFSSNTSFSKRSSIPVLKGSSLNLSARHGSSAGEEEDFVKKSKRSGESLGSDARTSKKEPQRKKLVRKVKRRSSNSSEEKAQRSNNNKEAGKSKPFQEPDQDSATDSGEEIQNRNRPAYKNKPENHIFIKEGEDRPIPRIYVSAKDPADKSTDPEQVHITFARKSKESDKPKQKRRDRSERPKTTPVTLKIKPSQPVTNVRINSRPTSETSDSESDTIKDRGRTSSDSSGPESDPGEKKPSRAWRDIPERPKSTPITLRIKPSRSITNITLGSLTPSERSGSDSDTLEEISQPSFESSGSDSELLNLSTESNRTSIRIVPPSKPEKKPERKLLIDAKSTKRAPLNQSPDQAEVIYREKTQKLTKNRKPVQESDLKPQRVEGYQNAPPQRHHTLPRNFKTVRLPIQTNKNADKPTIVVQDTEVLNNKNAKKSTLIDREFSEQKRLRRLSSSSSFGRSLTPQSFTSVQSYDTNRKPRNNRSESFDDATRHDTTDVPRLIRRGSQSRRISNPNLILGRTDIHSRRENRPKSADIGLRRTASLPRNGRRQRVKSEGYNEEFVTIHDFGEFNLSKSRTLPYRKKRVSYDLNTKGLDRGERSRSSQDLDFQRGERSGSIQGFQGERPRSSQGLDFQRGERPRSSQDLYPQRGERLSSSQNLGFQGGERPKSNQGLGFQGERPRSSQGFDYHRGERPNSSQGFDFQRGERPNSNQGLVQRGERPKSSQGLVQRGERPKSSQGFELHRGERPRSSQGLYSPKGQSTQVSQDLAFQKHLSEHSSFQENVQKSKIVGRQTELNSKETRQQSRTSFEEKSTKRASVVEDEVFESSSILKSQVSNKESKVRNSESTSKASKSKSITTSDLSEKDSGIDDVVEVKQTDLKRSQSLPRQQSRKLDAKQLEFEEFIRNQRNLLLQQLASKEEQGQEGQKRDHKGQQSEGQGSTQVNQQVNQVKEVENQKNRVEEEFKGVKVHTNRRQKEVKGQTVKGHHIKEAKVVNEELIQFTKQKTEDQGRRIEQFLGKQTNSEKSSNKEVEIRRDSQSTDQFQLQDNQEAKQIEEVRKRKDSDRETIRVFARGKVIQLIMEGPDTEKFNQRQREYERLQQQQQQKQYERLQQQRYEEQQQQQRYEEQQQQQKLVEDDRYRYLNNEFDRRNVTKGYYQTEQQFDPKGQSFPTGQRPDIAFENHGNIRTNGTVLQHSSKSHAENDTTQVTRVQRHQVEAGLDQVFYSICTHYFYPEDHELIVNLHRYGKIQVPRGLEHEDTCIFYNHLYVYEKEDVFAETLAPIPPKIQTEDIEAEEEPVFENQDDDTISLGSSANQSYDNFDDASSQYSSSSRQRNLYASLRAQKYYESKRNNNNNNETSFDRAFDSTYETLRHKRKSTNADDDSTGDFRANSPNSSSGRSETFSYSKPRLLRKSGDYPGVPREVEDDYPRWRPKSPTQPDRVYGLSIGLPP